ncbi:MAG: MaoC family dehydratase N-terminal domain-containing protein [Deltaproteobacteria bacterium]|nr:MaoC family dehydratase N-terminal domain-containing protein [Deltaproteobacteria bacterium]
MELSADLVGTSLKPYRREITWRETMNYAAAVGDDNPRYFDDERDGGIVAPPLFGVAVTWPILERIWEFIDSDRFPPEVLLTQVHHTEHLIFHRPIRPGDNLTVQGRIAAVLPHRAGTQVVICFEALDQKGQPVFTEHTGALLRGVSCTGSGRGREALPAVPAGPAADRALWETPLPIDPLQPFIYDGCANIYFPIHTSKSFARQVGLPGIILQGTATMALAAREILNREVGGDPQRLQVFSGRFTGMVFPGTSIRVQLTGKKPGPAGSDLHFIVYNQEGRPAVSQGYAFIKNG